MSGGFQKTTIEKATDLIESLSVKTHRPPGAVILYQEILYNQPSFLDANNSLPQLHFYLLSEEGAEALAHIAFSREESEVISPYRASFGGFEVSEDLNSEAFLFFVTEVVRLLRQHHVRFVKLHMPPLCYQPNLAMMEENLRLLGFREKRKLEHHIIAIDKGQPLKNKMVPMEQRKLRKAVKAGLVFTFEEKNEFTSVLNFIRQHREARGHQLSINKEELKESVRKNPDRYLFATVRQEERLIAAALLVRASSKVIYYFHPVHDREFNTFSPMVFLISNLYDWCEENGLESIDLGTSYQNKVQSPSLVRFKEHMGGRPQLSRIFRKALT